MNPPKDNPDRQLGLNFEGTPHPAPGPPGDGLSRWRQDRRAALETLARKLGYPLGHRVELILTGGIVLRGRLDLAEEELLHPSADRAAPQLRIDRCTFRLGEIESCVRLD